MQIPAMLHWWATLDLRGKMIAWGLFGLGVNGSLLSLGFWMPMLLIGSVALLLIAFLFVPRDDSDTQ